MLNMESTKQKTELLEKDAIITKMRSETTRMQQEMNTMLNSINEDKDKMRSEYMTVIERLKQENKGLNENLVSNARQGQDLNAQQQTLIQENERLRSQLAESER